MCGGHNHRSASAPEGVSREVKTYGEIEPCKLTVKAAAPIRRFHALKELLTAIDTIIGKNYNDIICYSSLIN